MWRRVKGRRSRGMRGAPCLGMPREIAAPGTACSAQAPNWRASQVATMREAGPVPRKDAATRDTTRNGPFLRWRGQPSREIDGRCDERTGRPRVEHVDRGHPEARSAWLDSGENTWRSTCSDARAWMQSSK